MIDYLGYNLTQYKSFRQLELQHTKIKTQNENLNYRLDEMTKKYQQKCKQVIQLKSVQIQEKLKLKNKNLKYKALYNQLMDSLQANFSCLKGKIQQRPEVNQPPNKNHDKSVFVHLQQVQKVEKMCKMIEQFTKGYLDLEQKSTSQSKKLQRISVEQKSSSLQKQKTQNLIVKQISYLQRQLQELNDNNNQLEAKVHVRERQKKQLQMELKQIKQECQMMGEKINDLVNQMQRKKQQDSEFSLDLMSFQVHTIQEIFTKLASQTKYSQQISKLMQVLYSDYEQISVIFKEKLQIQYDLEELQRRYKSQKNTKQAEQMLLIQTRRQIEAFRLELLKQKQILKQKQLHMDDHFKEYIKVNEQELKLKRYSYELQNRLYQQKKSQLQTCDRFSSRNPTTARDILAKRQKRQQQLMELQNQQEYPFEQNMAQNKKTALKFKQSNNVEQLMRQIVKQDKDNLQKILKQTRKTKIPNYRGK